ncbi:caspase family protein [Usitatibacter palustris]|uniref:Caspase family p20 domain-containing protein n=1 Tax=Usitatibacter palustris TaxID=2732487 RepID=A0A6M4HAV1_9PROT|nr:caspase family protein [Usitatibacter palustris]QJR16706.1 hypothetical protein DSM104440_03542 [Usitatibacter palustris]
MLKRLALVAGCSVLAGVCLLAKAEGTEPRVALVIGNYSYPVGPLKNPGNDADGVADTLIAIGFDVIKKKNLTQPEMVSAVNEFYDRLRPGSLALVYYSGHGMEVRGVNYLLPVDVRLRFETDVDVEGIRLNWILQKLADAGTDTNIVVLDACRNNPFENRLRSGVSRGLAQIVLPAATRTNGTFVAYATAPGSVADDGSGEYGRYTSEFISIVPKTPEQVELVFRAIRNRVIEESREQQQPWDATSLRKPVYLARQISIKDAEMYVSNPLNRFAKIGPIFSASFLMPEGWVMRGPVESVANLDSGATPGKQQIVVRAPPGDTKLENPTILCDPEPCKGKLVSVELADDKKTAVATYEPAIGETAKVRLKVDAYDWRRVGVFNAKSGFIESTSQAMLTSEEARKAVQAIRY